MDYQYVPPHAVTRTRRETGPLVLERCGSKRRIVLTRCRDQCLSIQLGGGVVTWVQGNPLDLRYKLYVYLIRKRQRYALRLPRAGYVSAAHTQTRAYVSLTPPAGEPIYAYRAVLRDASGSKAPG